MSSGSRARRLASALLLCAVSGPALADGEAAAGRPAPRATQRPPPMVLVVPLGAGLILPLTLPTATPRVRTAAEPRRQDGSAAEPPEPGREASPREPAP